MELLALLFNHKGTTRQQLRHMTEWELVNGYLRPNANAGHPERPWYWPVQSFDPRDPPTGGEVGWAYIFWKVHKPAAEAQGVRLTDEQWQERWEEFSKSMSPLDKPKSLTQFLPESQRNG